MEFNLFLPLAGLLVGIIIGLTGLGGGSIMTPALIFGLGVPPSVAVGTDLIFAGVTKSIGVYAHRLAGNIDWRTVKLLASGSLPGALATIVVADRFLASPDSLNAAILPVLGVALILTAGVLIVRGRVVRLAARFSHHNGPLSGFWLVSSGVVLGILVALSSVGAGAIGIAALTLFRPTWSARRLVGTDIAHALPLALVAGLGHQQFLGTVDFGLLTALLVGSIPGIYLGSAMTGRVPEPVLRCLLVAVLVTAGILCMLP